jgi:putative transposase
MDFANDGPRRPGEVDIDLGIAQTVTLSDGTAFHLDVESIKKHEKQIAVLQRQLCRNKEARQKLAKLGKANPFDKREPSRMRRRLKAKILNHHRCIRNIRRDFMLKTAHTIAQNYGLVAMEDLKLKNMTKSARGTVEEPGKNVRQKTGLNRSLARVAPYAMRMAIHWAVFKANGRLILVDPKYTSQTCPICGYTSSSNRPSQAHFGCQKCGYTANADVVGATNVLKKSRTGSVRPCSELGNKTATGTVLFVAS